MLMQCGRDTHMARTFFDGRLIQYYSSAGTPMAHEAEGWTMYNASTDAWVLCTNDTAPSFQAFCDAVNKAFRAQVHSVLR